MRRSGSMLSLVLAACASTPGTSVPRALERFALACQFVPPDLMSFSFREEELDPEAAGLPATAPRQMRVVRAGRDFMPPLRHGYGKYAGVEIMDFGPDGLAPYMEPEEQPPAAVVAGIPVWFTPEQSQPNYIAPEWHAYVDGRYIVLSSEREMLAKALERSGRLDRILQPFAAAGEIAHDATEIVCALPRPGDGSYWGRPVPIEPVITLVRPGPWRLQAFHRQALPQAYLDLFDALGDPTRRSSARIGPWTMTEVPLEEAEPPYTTVIGGLAFDLLFGLAVFI